MFDKENKEQFLVEKKEKKNQQRIQRLTNNFPSQDDFYIHMVSNALKPDINKK